MNNDYLYQTDEEKKKCKVSWKNIINIGIIILIVILLLYLIKNIMEPKQEVILEGGVYTPSSINLTAISPFEK